jgi:hypothetical protein
VSLPEEFAEAHGLIERLRSEYVVAVTGTLREREKPNSKVVRCPPRPLASFLAPFRSRTPRWHQHTH